MSKLFDTPEKQLANFLGAHFHQDIDSPEQALEEYTTRGQKELLLITIDCATEFLRSSRSEQEKADFIESNAEIYFPAIGLTPIQWLEQVIQVLREAAENK